MELFHPKPFLSQRHFNMLVSILILATIRTTRQVVNQQSQLALFVVAFAMLISQGILGLPAYGQDPNAAEDLERSLFNKQSAGLDVTADVDQQQLREGTLVPPTEGRMVMLGRRWAFVSSEPTPSTDDDFTSIESRTSASAVGFRSKPRPTRLGGRGGRDKPKSETLVLVRNRNQGATSASPDIRRMIVAENLMLQRIVEAIRADSSDDRWMISGEVTEFFNENRLLIRTAQRATSK